MYNILLDRLPTDYHGYLIRTSFRIGMQICLCAKDVDFTDEEKILTSLSLLYGKGVPPDLNEAIEGLSWFLACGNPSKNSSGSKEKDLFFFDFDSARLQSSFMQTYGIDLSKEDMHWFQFISLLGSLDKNCAFSKAVEIRGYDMSKLKGKERAEMQKLKSELTPEMEYSSEEKEQIEKFNKLWDGGDVNE